MTPLHMTSITLCPKPISILNESINFKSIIGEMKRFSGEKINF